MSDIPIAPLERLRLSQQLDGTLRPIFSEISSPIFKNDIYAITRWLQQVTANPNTYKSYRAEAEKCLLWATLEQGTPFSALEKTDVLAYAQFLESPRPADKWICVGTPRRNDPAWRPFRGDISERSRKQSLIILSSLFDWLWKWGYVEGNPVSEVLEGVDAVPGIDRSASYIDRVGVISLTEWRYVETILDKKCLNLIDARAKLLFYLGYYADLKLAEILALSVSSIRVSRSRERDLLFLSILERKEQRRDVYLVQPLQEAASNFLRFRAAQHEKSLDEDPLTEKLVAGSYYDISLSPSEVHVIAVDIFRKAAEIASIDNNPLAARRLQYASFNWLNHAFELHCGQMGVAANSWLLVGAAWLGKYISTQYLPDRLTASAAEIQGALEEVNTLLAQRRINYPAVDVLR